MRLEGDDDERGAESGCLFGRCADYGLVAPMHAIEIAEQDHAATRVARYVLEMTQNSHRPRSAAPARGRNAEPAIARAKI
jgi:hypothetical protein